MAHGAGTADSAAGDRRIGLDVPPASFIDRLRRMWLTDRAAQPPLGFHDGNAMYLLNHSGLVDDGRARLESDHRTPFVGADIRPWLGKVISRHSWIARWSSWLLGTAIYVSPMSGTWLRAFEDHWSKRGVDV